MERKDRVPLRWIDFNSDFDCALVMLLAVLH